jgi:hypothetical protein
MTDSITNLNTVLAFETDLTLGATDVYEAVTILATIHEGTEADLKNTIDNAKAWYLANGGMSMFADNNDDGQIDICSGCCEVMGDYNHDGRFDILDLDDFIHWTFSIWPNFPPYCLEEVDVTGDGVISILDLDFLVGYLLRDEPVTMPQCP